MIWLVPYKKLEPMKAWVSRITAERAAQKVNNPLGREPDLHWAVKLLYYCPFRIQEHVWEVIGPTGFEIPKNYEGAAMIKLINTAAIETKQFQDFAPSKAFTEKWGPAKAALKQALGNGETKKKGRKYRPTQRYCRASKGTSRAPEANAFVVGRSSSRIVSKRDFTGASNWNK